MYLKSLEVQGFKSFPDKTVLNFNKGITAVVGPNGSGKSNIGDAMRWVMGEQSPKSLRGDKMSGIIFHGTQNRPKASFAQVTITIDNEDRALDFDSNIVSVSRKLYRNGDSEYMINGNGVRLKDVFELFLDTGLGKEGYSVIYVINEEAFNKARLFLKMINKIDDDTFIKRENLEQIRLNSCANCKLNKKCCKNRGI